MPMPTMTVKHEGGVASSFNARGHRVLADVPEKMGGQDRGPTPVELFAGSLGSCIAFYVARWCTERDLPFEGFQIELDYLLDMEAHCIPVVNVRIEMPADFPEGRHDALLRVAEHCTVHNTICAVPKVNISVAAAPVAVCPN